MKLSERMTFEMAEMVELHAIEVLPTSVAIWADEVAQLEAENNELIAAVAGMRDKWTPPDEVAQLEAENEALKTELRGERERLLLEMYNNDTISQVQFDHAMNELALLEASK